MPWRFDADSVALQINFHAPNGWWSETVKGVRVENKLIFAISVWKLGGTGPILCVAPHGSRQAEPNRMDPPPGLPRDFLDVWQIHG
jgi:hypothetical protein